MKITNDAEGKRFFTTVKGGDAHILYNRGPNNIYDLYATYVPTESRGHNIADQLVREAIRVAKEEKVQILDTCPYVHSWFRKHPEESDILFGAGESIVELY
ncbi:MAG: N-acetyltransferase [Bdellovibrio sp.]|nr:N-acetyltransferase [Bdellovibrio sp.]